MAKRLTDCDKWTKVWFRKLQPVYKCFWVYICDRCDHVGIWEVDFEMASLYIGADLDIDTIKTVFNKQYIELNGGSKWLIKDFLFFQYGPMNKDNKMFNTIEASLLRNGLKMGDIWGIHPLMVSVKVKVKVKDTVKEEESKTIGDVVLEFPFLKDKNFVDIFNDYLSGRKKKATDRAKELILKDLHKYDVLIAIQMLEQSIKNGWVGVFPLKEANKNNTSVDNWDKQIAEQLGKMADKDMIKKFLLVMPKSLWWKVDAFLKKRYSGYTGKSFDEAQREVGEMK